VFMRLLYCFIALLLKFEISLRLGQTDIMRQGRCMLANRGVSFFSRKSAPHELLPFATTV
jgi:hypothetical protein